MDWYLIVKALHIIAVIAWMAGMLYLPRLFVYHAEAEPGTDKAVTFKVMERRLLRAIMNPAMIGVWVFGLWMLYLVPDWMSDGWLHAKLFLVAAMTYVHHLLGRWRKAFERDQVPGTTRFFRIINEVPTVFLILIVFLVVLKPF